jgi:hypothetical protein
MNTTRRLAAILVADVVRCLMGADEVATLQALKAHIGATWLIRRLPHLRRKSSGDTAVVTRAAASVKPRRF